MSASQTKGPTKGQTKRRFVDPEQPRYDEQGERSDTDRVQSAVASFIGDFNADSAGYMEACVHCGLCADACQFYTETKDPQYTPIHKIKPFKRAYQREVGPFAWLKKLTTKSVSLDELREWQHLIYDSCTMCGRCTMVCPMGIDIPSLIAAARRGMWAAGLAPDRLAQIAGNAERNEGSQSANPQEFAAAVVKMSELQGVEFPLDAPEADVLVTLSAGTIEGDGAEIASIAKILEAAGYTWTLSTYGYEATNFGMLSGHIDLQKQYSLRIADAAERCKAKFVLLPECGHAYGALRWEGPNWYGKPYPFQVLHMSEFLGQIVRDKKIKLRKAGDAYGTVTYHDPCQAARRGGIYDAPREVLEALGMPLKELRENKEYNWCCGGGGGALANKRNVPLRQEVFKIKIRQVEEVGADTVVSACHQCHITFKQGKAAHHWDTPFESLMELVAHHLET